MARIKITLPDQFKFSTEIPVRITDVNYGGHVGNDAMLGIIHEARMKFFNHHDFSEMNLGGAGVIMADVAIEFKHEAFYGDSIIASVVANEFSRIGFDLFYKLETQKNGKLITIAIAKTGMICYDYQLKKIIAVPQKVLEAFQ